MSSFNIIVPSDTNSELYPANTSSRFKVRLSEPIELDQRGNWEVALADLQVPTKLKKQDYQMVVHSTHPDSTEQRKTTNREEFLTHLQAAIKAINVSTTVTYPSGIKHFNAFVSNIHLKTYNDNIVNPPVIVFEFTGKCDSPILQNVMFLQDSHIQSGHLGDSLPMKLKLNNVASLFLGISKTASIVSPWPVVPRFNFDRSMFEPTTNETLYLPLDENQARMTDCYTNSGYYIYFYQHVFMSKPRAVYIPKATEQGVVGLFQESLKQMLDFSETVDITKPIHASTVNFSVSSSDPYRSRLNIALAVKKAFNNYTIFRNYNSLLQIFICKELASALNMANSSVWIYFPQWYEPTMKQRLSAEDMQRLKDGDQFNGMACVPATKKDVFSTVEGKYDWNFPRVRTVESNGDYTRVHYIANFKLRGREEFRSGIGSSRANPTLYDKLYDEENYKISIEVPLKIKYQQENLVQYLNIHCDELLYDEVLRSVNRPLEGTNDKTVNVDMRHLHYKKVKGGMRQLHDFQIEIKDGQDQLVKFEDGLKSIMTLNFKPTKSKELSHFTKTVGCQVTHKLNEPIPLKTTDTWQVALMDITFPRRWINVKENEMVFYMGNDGVYDQTTTVSGAQSTFTPTKYVLPSGGYTNESLVAKMNEMALNPFTSGWYRFYIYPNSQVFKVDLVKKDGSTSNLSVKIPAPLCQVLGWETEKEFNLTAGWVKPDDTDQYHTAGNLLTNSTSGTTYSFRNKKLIKIDVNRGYNIMYVYAPSLIQDVYVGHTKTELLNYTVPGLAEVRGDSYFVQFNSLSYVKLKNQLHSINEILVEIRNELGDLYEFTDVGQRPTASLKFEISDQL